ncbi:GNAT family N-acetyltransferase [Paenibacillus sp. FSL R7-0297]|uniref:GNAT family N-acetyltransferase n=1 Tax=Paenibacillus sp. FSL R7-0297 TaxID=2921680 RepID=UPI0030F95EB2
MKFRLFAFKNLHAIYHGGMMYFIVIFVSVFEEEMGRDMGIEFRKISEFGRGTLFELLKDAYAFNCRYEQSCLAEWREFDNFFFDNLQIADKYGFITTLNGEAIGFVTWDPRNLPEVAEIGHNCIASAHKGKGYSKMQLQEAVNRILQKEVRKIIVTTNDDLVPARRMYESIGFTLARRRPNNHIAGLDGEHLDYVYFV